MPLILILELAPDPGELLLLKAPPGDILSLSKCTQVVRAALILMHHRIMTRN